MAYIDVITLAEAKEYLRIDDTLTEDDTQITRMISTALIFVENNTGHMVYSRDKDYVMVDGFIRVYDTPITAIVTPTEADMDNEQKTLYKNFCYGIETSTLTLTVGYTTKAAVPPGLIDVALEVIDILYYGNETGKTVHRDLSPMSKSILEQHKRFIL